MPYRRTSDEIQTEIDRRPWLREVSGFAAQHTMISPYARTTVVKSPDVVVRGRWDRSVDGFVGEDLLLNHRREPANLGTRLGVSRFFEPDAALASCHLDLAEDLVGALELPKPKQLRAGLTSTVSSRRSHRSFSGQAVRLVDLATVLHHVQGVSGEIANGQHNEPDATVKLRMSPSGGGLYPVRVYVFAINVAGLASGAYRYLPSHHRLAPVGEPVPGDRLLSLLDFTDFPAGSGGFALTYVYDLYVNSRKYGDSGLVYALIETGGMSLNAHLAATALGLRGCDQGGYDKPRLERALGLDSVSQHVVHFTVIGDEE